MKKTIIDSANMNSYPSCHHLPSPIATHTPVGLVLTNMTILRSTRQPIEDNTLKRLYLSKTSKFFFPFVRQTYVFITTTNYSFLFTSGHKISSYNISTKRETNCICYLPLDGLSDDQFFFFSSWLHVPSSPQALHETKHL